MAVGRGKIARAVDDTACFAGGFLLSWEKLCTICDIDNYRHQMINFSNKEAKEIRKRFVLTFYEFSGANEPSQKIVLTGDYEEILGRENIITLLLEAHGYPGLATFPGQRLEVEPINE